jgi:hypothetical protein
MSGRKRWLIVVGLVVMQAGIVFTFVQLQTAAPSEAAAADQPAPPQAAPAPDALDDACRLKVQAATPSLQMNVTPALPEPPTAPPARPAEGSPSAPIPQNTTIASPRGALGASEPVPPTSGPEGSPTRAVPAAPAPPPAVCPWTFHLVVVEGRTVLTAKVGGEVQFKVTCDRLDLQAPNGAIQAAGAIKLTSAGLEGSSERLTINLREDRVILDGQAHLKARRQSQELELQAERLSLRLVDGRLGDSAETAEPPAGGFPGPSGLVSPPPQKECAPVSKVQPDCPLAWKETSVVVYAIATTLVPTPETKGAEQELAERLIKVLKKRYEDDGEKVKIVPLYLVRAYQNKAPHAQSPFEVGKQFQADKVVCLEVSKMSLYKEGGFNQLFFGRLEMTVSVTDMHKERENGPIFRKECVRYYPRTGVIEADSCNPAIFRGAFLTNVAEKVSSYFTSHVPDLANAD